ncbi:fatty acid cis/trans isomerase [uncultured Oxalicibacterium sp.]|uniref:fatty acid cis/trans isomerase n=1 Tax=uncultured Oxalicibacterium sp. TaxID=1168540 RepID=UPI0025F6D25A|nr:fatty acid cis/trans isomerase [uncultured Oxalicibacterium sp.]
MRRIVLIPLLMLVACTTLATAQFNRLYGTADPARFDEPSRPPTGLSYNQTIRPILDQRCVVCHACYDAPCQLKTTSWEGLSRGASKTTVYDAGRLIASAPSRLYIDAENASEWRTKGFFSVLNEHEQTPEANRSANLIYRMLMLKQQHPWPSNDATLDKLDISSTRSNMCPAGAEMDVYEQTVPLGGMPFGLPALSPDEQRTLLHWLELGAPAEKSAALPNDVQQEVSNWERFFNGNANKEQLFARYAYEHLFLAHLYFGNDKQRHYFKLVRSTTPPGQPIRIIPSARPVDDPKVKRVYYRLTEERETIVAKTHLPYRLDAQRMARWKTLFLEPNYSVQKLPGYTERTAANPFETYADLPVGARYRFMLDEAEFTIMGFIKGPVCRGQLALNVIQDQFWVTFMAPSDAYDKEVDRLLQRSADLASLPTGSSTSGILTPWLKYGKLENEYLKERSKLLNKAIRQPTDLNLNLIWDGDGNNDNAALTILRHFDGASVVKGFIGETPKTAWVIGYPLLERIHYLLVANYDVYGNVGHQFNSRLYMDYLRAEGESGFLMFLPKAERIAVRDDWYRGDSQSVRDQVYGGPSTTLDTESGVRYQTNQHKRELLELMRQRVGKVINTDFDWQRQATPVLHAPLRSLAATHGTALQWLPESAVLVVDMPNGQKKTFSLMRNTARASVSHLLGENQSLLPKEDTLTLATGVAFSYPNAFYNVSARELSTFVQTLQHLKSEKDYAAFTKRWAVKRDNPGFWAFSDAVHERYRKEQPNQAGILDYNRMEYR